MPPKKDAFADLFSSASGTKSKKDQPMNGISVHRSTGNNAFSGLDILSGSSTPTGSLGSMSSNNGGSLTALSNGSSTLVPQASGVSGVGSNGVLQPKSSNGSSATSINRPNSATQSRSNTPISTSVGDPWDIFGSSAPAKAPTSKPTTSSSNNGSINLLDDEFTDAFTEEIPPRPSSVQPTRIKDDKSSVPITSSSSSSSRSSSSNVSSTTSQKDHVLAELMEIGFPIEIARRAIESVGSDVQRCVNFIMEGSSPSSERKPSPTHQQPQDLNSKINDLSADLFSKASFFINKSKKTVLKNIEQFQQPKGDSSRPTWMRNQPKYESWLPEGVAEGSTTPEETLGKLQRERPRESKYSDDNNDQNIGERKQKPPVARRQEVPIIGRPSNSRPSSQSQSPSLQSSPMRPPSSKSVTPVQQKARVASPVPAELIAKKSPVPPSSDFDLLGLNQKESQSLDQFLQTDYDKHKSLATNSFTKGDYDLAFTNYKKCLEILPDTFDLKIVILSNLALTCIKIGNYKQARLYSEDGLSKIPKDKLNDASWIVHEKSIKSWYIKLLSRKAESLEQLELFSESLESYQTLIKMGVNDKKVMDAKRRVDGIVNPKKAPPPAPVKKVPTKPNSASTASAIASKKVREQFDKQREEDDAKFKLHDQIQAKLSTWSAGKEDNLRTLLVGLPDVIPSHLPFPFLTKKITINDIMLPKKVKINYMKVISAIHPDKLGKLELQERMICQGVFVVLNKAWDSFKENELS
ncbi:auxilin-like clathrin uncoating factor Swa2p [[Candida] anglica]